MVLDILGILRTQLLFYLIIQNIEKNKKVLEKIHIGKMLG
jgi:hypothetical protein